jgi:hypothetical protein
MISLRLPLHYRDRIASDGLLWHSRYASALPYASFIGDDELQERWLKLGREAWTDPEMHRQLTLLMGEFPRIWWESDSRFSPEKLLSSLMRDPSMQRHMAEMLEVLEPHFEKGIRDILWNQAASVEGGPKHAPNVKLIWAARRLLFGAQEPALTILARPETSASKMPDVIQVKEVL